MDRKEVTLDDDPGMSRHLANILGILSSAPGMDKDFKAQIQDILQGTGTIRDLAQSEAFDRVSDSIVPQALADFASMPEDERERMAAQGEAVLERYRQQEEPPASQPSTEKAPPAASSPPQMQDIGNAQPTTAPGTRKPYREQVVGPSDSEDEDDQYFRDRNQNGWLR
jgi:hypothetical protein